MQLIISDACRGLLESIAEYLPEARWQRCVVHFYRNVFSHVPTMKVREISPMLKAIHAQESRETAQEKAATVVEDLRRQKLGKAAELVEAHIDETLSYYRFPDSHWLKIRTNNPLERIMREIRRRTRVVGAFPDGKSCLNLAAARLRHIAASQWSTRKYMNMAPSTQSKPQPTEPSPEKMCERFWTLPRCARQHETFIVHEFMMIGTEPADSRQQRLERPRRKRKPVAPIKRGDLCSIW